jgi:glycosyltransferase involved in cell wall biosynthesis
MMVSLVIPIHDEEAILRAAIVDLRARLAEETTFRYEVVLVENGSRDATRTIAQQLASRHSEVRVLTIPEANYGRALRTGIEAARGDVVICEEIDLCDVDFHRRAVELLEHCDMVIGSKLMAGAADERPWLRHVASRFYNGTLRAAFGFEGTDTHGLKAFRKAALIPIVESCIVDKDVFASELTIRAYRGGVRITEIPVRVLEKRPPSINLVRRVPAVVSRLVRLARAVGLR